MKKRIITLLKYTPYQYEMMAFELYCAWCDEHSFNNYHLQKLISSRKLHGWFMREYRAKELQFLEYVKNYENCNKQELRDLYDSMTCSINYYPKPLLNAIRKTIKKTTVTGAHPAVKPNFN